MRSEPPLILAFDTSAARCAAALLCGACSLAERDEPMDRGQAERLLPMLEEILAEAGRAWRDLDAIAVCTGPGNFTGLRLGVAAARGLAMALRVPAIGVTRFEALVPPDAGAALVTLDAHRGSVYAQTFQGGRPAAPPVVCELAALNRPPRGTICVGHRADEIAALHGLRAGSVVERPACGVLARIAAGRLSEPQPPPAPLYIRPADAAPSAERAPVLLDDA